MKQADRIPRTCTEVAKDEHGGTGIVDSQPLRAFRHVPAYVLLGEPGSGKTTEFEQEFKDLGDAAAFITAREFRHASDRRLSELRGKVLFIDGLDETRAGGIHGSEAIDEIQAKLFDLRQPAFRISCRVADWFGPVDRSPLSRASPDGRIATLLLDRLSRGDARWWLEARSSTDDAAAFLLTASARGFDSMLESPQQLRFLYESVTDGNWPATRSETFRRTAERLASEPREDHPRASEVVPMQQVLNVAGRVFAIQLLSGSAGVAFGSGSLNADFLVASDIAVDLAMDTGSSAVELRRVVSTGLFKGSGDQRFEPVHRQVAEYLGACHLSDLIERGVVSVGRVCTAIMSPVDGRAVTDMRGLAAWLGTHSASTRSLLIEADPVGVALYGDISDWPAEDRRTLLDCLVSQARPEDLWGVTRFDAAGRRYRDSTAWSFRSLSKPDMADAWDALLGAAQRGDMPSHIVELLLRSLAEAEHSWLAELSSLAPRVSEFASSETSPPDIRLAALLAFARIERSASEVETTLGEALDGVRGGRLADPDGRIGGSLLRLLYPGVITPSEIWAYASLLHRGAIGGESWEFWRGVLCDETPIEQLPQVLDGFAEQAERLWPILSSAFANDVPLRLLNRALREVGRETEPKTIYRWIAAVVARYERRRRNMDEAAELKAWLDSNEEIALQLRGIWIARSVADDSGIDERHSLRDLLLPDHPQDFLAWCIDAARERQSAAPEVASAFVREAYYALPKMHEQFGTSLDDLRGEIGSDELLTAALDALTARSSTLAEIERADEEWRQELAELEARHERERQERRRDWSAHLREHIQELHANSFSAPNLHTLALAYFGLLMEVNDDDPPLRRVADLIGDDAEVFEAAIEALRNAPIRADVPSVERTAELTADSKHDWLAYPVLAGLAIRHAEGTLDRSWLSEKQQRQAVAIASTALVNPNQQPSWAVDWLHEDPAPILDVLHRCAVAELRKGDTHLSLLNWLLEVKGLDDELYEFRLGLLRSMSVRMPRAQLQLFDYLVSLVLNKPDSDPLLKLTSRKLASTSMTDAQRVRWLTIDALLRGGTALERLDEFLRAKPAGEAELAPFLSALARRSSYGIESAEDTANVEAWVKIVGRAIPPRSWGRAGEVVSIGPPEEVAGLISGWIDELGSQPTAEAGAALDALISDDRLGAWRTKLELTRDQQQRLYRDASYEPMNVVEVLDLLRNGPPGSAADLHSLLCDLLADLDQYIRGDNSDPWRDFWKDERQRRPSEPRHEETCRDALLRMLRARLPDSIDAQPEGQYPADRRADIRVSYRNYNIPVEIKKNSHQDLWTAIHDQLIAKYITDPGTGGYGIYLVLWFGSDVAGYPRNPTTGDRPETSEELARNLSDTIPPEVRRRVCVIVIDVTKP